VIATVAVLALTHLPGASRAEDAGPPFEDGPKTLAKYVTCAVTLGLAPTVFTAVTAFLGCIKLFTEEMPT
jgi:hypothetical protein